MRPDERDSQRQRVQLRSSSARPVEAGSGRPVRPSNRPTRPADDTLELVTPADRSGSFTAPDSDLPTLADELPRTFAYAGRRELADELDGMAASLGEVDPRSAERLGDLARSITTEDGRARWADVDLRRAFNTERLATARAERMVGKYAAGTHAMADRIRNVLVLFPILLTWFALFEAARAYYKLYQRDPTLAVETPLLLLWQRGFDGEASAFAPSFSTVALLDAVIILFVVILTFYNHGQREGRDDRVYDLATSFQTDLDNVLGAATVVLAVDKARRPALLARSIERLTERFDHSTQELLTRLRVEHDRLESIANRREREFADFGVFASGMRAGAEESHRLLVDLRQVSTSLQAALEDLTSEVGATGEQQRGLMSAVTNLERMVAAGIQSDQAVTRQLGDAASNLAEAADKALTGSETAAQAGRVATEAVRSIAEIASELAKGQSRVEEAIAKEAEANADLASALRGGHTGVATAAGMLNDIGAGLARLREDFHDLAEQSRTQTRELNRLLDEQGTIASGLSQVARDLSAVGIATAQRQREVNDDLVTLLGRLEDLTTLLARATADAPTTDALRQAFGAAIRDELSGNGQGWSGRGAEGDQKAGGLWSRGGRRTT